MQKPTFKFGVFRGAVHQLVVIGLFIACAAQAACAQEDPRPAEPKKADKPSKQVAPSDSKPLETAKPSKPKRPPIYVEEANGKELIAAALKRAQRDHKRVLIEWGGNWCGWCYKLHDVFRKDETIHPMVHEEFELVLIDCGPNAALMKEYGGEEREYSFPHLTLLDEEGKVLTNQETASLEEGDHHDPKLVAEFLKKWTPEKRDARKLIAETLLKAGAEDKRVLVRVGTPYCGWCNVLSEFMQAHQEILAADYIDLKIDTLRMEHGEEVAQKFSPKNANGGIPWFVILNGEGETLTTSYGPEGNVGYPYQPQEIAHFVSMLRQTRRKLTDDDLKKIEADLHAYRQEKETKQTQ